MYILLYGYTIFHIKIKLLVVQKRIQRQNLYCQCYKVQQTDSQIRSEMPVTISKISLYK